jgi:hypothetical protein
LEDPLWRMTNLYWIVDENGRRVKFTFRPAILKLLQEMHLRNLILKARQLGFSTFVAIYFLDSCLFAPNVQAAMVAHRLESAKKLFATKILYPWNNLAQTLKDHLPLAPSPSGRPQASTTELQWSHGSGIVVDVSVRSGTYNLVHVSEYPWLSVNNPIRANEVKTGTLETAHQAAIVFIEGTGYGPMGEFYEMWRTAEQHRGPLGPFDYKQHFFAWFDNPAYVLDPIFAEVAEKDESYFASVIAYWSERGRQIELSPPQKAWYVSKAHTLKDDMFREHPSTPEEAFQSTVVGTFWAAQINEIERANPSQIARVPWIRRAPVYAFWDLGSMHTAVLFCQFIQSRIHIIDCYEDNSGSGLPVNIKAVQALPYNVPKDGHYSGWDLWGSNRKDMSGKVIVNLARENGIDFQKVDKHELFPGTENVRNLFSQIWVDQDRCAVPLEMWRKYRKKLNEQASTDDRQVFMEQEQPGPENHYSDCLRMLCWAYAYQAIGGQYLGNIEAVQHHYDPPAAAHPTDLFHRSRFYGPSRRR